MCNAETASAVAAQSIDAEGSEIIAAQSMPMQRPRAFAAQISEAAPLLDAIFEATHDVMLLFDDTGCLVRASASALALLGYSAQGVGALRCYDLIEYADDSASVGQVSDALPRLRHRDGTLLALSCSPRRVSQAGRPFMLYVGRRAAEDETDQGVPATWTPASAPLAPPGVRDARRTEAIESGALHPSADGLPENALDEAHSAIVDMTGHTSMGGTIGVESALGLGTTFTVRLPGARHGPEGLDGYDAVTTMPDRAAMLSLVLAELERARLDERPVAVLSLDIVHLARITLAHGRRRGDEVLRRVAASLRGALRGHDYLGRDGTDSFLALLPGADAREAASIVERLRQAVEDTTYAIGVAAIRLRLSAGMAVFPADGVDAQSLIRHAQSTRWQARGMTAVPLEPPLVGTDLPQHFALAVSHELRTPLTTILGSAEVLLHGWARLDDAARRKGVERLLSGARRLDLLVRDLLLVVGLEKGHLAVSPLQTGLTPLLEQAIYDASAAHPNLDLRARGLRGAPSVWADPDRVMQVLMHLIDNAARHGQGAGPPELRVEARPNEVEIRVTDRGPGLPTEGRPRLFTRFGKLSQNAHAGRIGTGLGLYISRLLVEAMGGAIGVESTPGKGASFWFTLPRSEMDRRDGR